MSDDANTAAAPIDTGAEVSVPEGEVTREQLVKILEDARASEPAGDEDAGEGTSAEGTAAASPAASDAPKEPPPEKVSARIIASRKAELRAAAEREAIARERAEIAQAKAEVEEHAKQAAALKAAKLSPSKALELLGMSPKEFLESLATEHEPSAVAKRESAGAMSEVEKLRAEIQELRESQARREHESLKQVHETNYNAATKAFLDHVDSAAETYPHLVAEYTPQEIAQLARQTAEQHAEAYFQKFKQYPSDEVIAEHLETQARARAEALAERRARVGIPAPKPSQGTSAVQGQPLKANTPRTLTNGASSQKATAPKPWSQKDADEESRRIIEQMYTSASSD